MAVTSTVLPAAATAQRVAGTLRARRLVRDGTGAPVPSPPLAVLLDRDGTLVHDVPYNKDPALVVPLPGVRRGLDRLRAHGIRLAIVSNQSGVARGLLTQDDVAAVMAGTRDLLGPIDDVRWCPHGPDDGCTCRKPAPGLLLEAATTLGVDPLRCALIGDIGADVEAAAAAGMRGILVPTPATRPGEVADARERAATFSDAVDLLLAGAPDLPAPSALRAAHAERREIQAPQPAEAVA
jgi:histidinol-phosphate phosphatase family protein